MRRNWTSVLLFALALAVQALAPAAANVAMAKHFGGTRASTEFCLNAGRNAGDQQQAPGHNERHRDACPLCQVSSDGVAPFAARPVLTGMAPVQWTALSWTAADRVLPTPRHEYSRQARAPPSFS